MPIDLNSEIEKRKKRTITDADAQAIARYLRAEIKEEFYNDLGRGVTAFVWKGIVIGLIMLAAYGASKSWHWGQ